MVRNGRGAKFDVHCEWGLAGLASGLPHAAAIVVVDVLSFSTAVDVAVGCGARVLPHDRPGVSAEDVARRHGALLASRDRHAGFSLSPASLLTLPAGALLVLPSPNGATLSLATGTTPTFCGCLRNAAAVAQAAARCGRPVLVVAAGERWPDRSLRPGVEDWLGAGAVIHALPGARSPDAALAEASFLAAQPELLTYLEGCASGQELIDRDCGGDVALAAALNISTAAPRLELGIYA